MISMSSPPLSVSSFTQPLTADALAPLAAAPTALLPFLDPEGIITSAGPWALLVVCLIVFAETALLVGFILPGDTLLLITGLLAFYPGIGFDERSSSWMQKVWVHRRRIEAVPGGCRLSDELEIAPRLRLQAPLVRWLVAALFRHRHRRLRARYGALAG